MIQTMQFTYGHLVTINSTKKLYYNIFTTKIYIFQNVHFKFYKKKHIATNIIHYYNNDFVHPTHSFFMIDKITAIVVNE